MVSWKRCPFDEDNGRVRFKKLSRGGLKEIVQPQSLQKDKAACREISVDETSISGSTFPKNPQKSSTGYLTARSR